MIASAAALRPWPSLQRDLRGLLPPHAGRADRMQAFVSVCWPHLAPTGVSWMGFYERDPSDPAALRLSAREPRPACSPIGLHGACGQSLLAARPLVVRDVSELGPHYIACDPRDRSEVVIPIYRGGYRWGVLDADSYEVACFGTPDIHGLCSVLRAAGLLAKDHPVRADRLQHTRESL